MLDIHNFHELFGNKEFQVGDRVRGLNTIYDWDLLIDIKEEPRYTLVGISRQNHDTIVKREYFKAEHVIGNEIGTYRRGSPEWEEFNKKLQEQ